MFSNFRHRKMQIGIIFIIITLAVVLLNGSVCILKSLEEPMKEFAKECDSPQMEAYPYFEDEQMIGECINRLESLSEVEKVERVHTCYLANGFTCRNKAINAYCALGEYNENVYGKVRVIEGTMEVGAYSERECAIPACIKNEYGVSLGDTISLTLENKTYSYEVAGIYTDLYDMSTAYDSRILVKSLPKELQKKGAILFLYTNGTTSAKIVEEYQERYGDLFMNLNTMQEQIDNNLISAHIIGGVFLAIGVIMLLVSIIVIFFIVKNTMLADAKKIAIYKTLGYSCRDILWMYLKFYGLIVAVGAATGVVGSRVLATRILNQIFLNMGMQAKVSLLFPGIFTFVATAVIVLGMIYLVIRKTKHVKPVYILNGLSNRNTKKKREYKGNLTMAFSPAGIALRNFLRNKKGSLGVIITSIVTIFAINFAIISMDIAFSMKDKNTFWFAFDPCDFIISVNGKEALTNAEKALKQNKDVVTYHLNTVNDQPKVQVEYQKGMTNTIIYPFVYESYEGVDLAMVEGRNPKNEKEIAITTLVADQMHKTIGDYIRVSLDTKTKVDLLITGTFQTYVNMGGSARMLGDTYTKNKVDFEYNTISVYIRDGADRDAVITELKQNIDSADSFKYREDCFESIMDLIAEPQKAGIPPVMVLVLVISAVNIFSIVLLKNAVNKKNNQIYKSIGYSTRDLILSNMIYVGGIAMVAMAVAIPVVIVTYPKILTTALSVFALKEYPMDINYVHLAAGNAAVLVLFLVSTMLSSRSLRKVNVRDLVID